MVASGGEVRKQYCQNHSIVEIKYVTAAYVHKNDTIYFYSDANLRMRIVSSEGRRGGGGGGHHGKNVAAVPQT